MLDSFHLPACREADDYTAHLVGDFTILGLSLGGFLLAVLVSCLTCCCCCKCCESIKARVRALDPRWADRWHPDTHLTCSGTL